MPIERINLIDYQRENFTEKELEELQNRADEVIGKLRILSFITNPNGDGRIVSRYNNLIVLVDWDYKGPPVAPGEVWLCSLESGNSVYIATPLKRITSNILMELDPSLKNSIIDELWNEKRDFYEAQFEEKYRQSLTQELSARFKQEGEDAIAGKDLEIGELNKRIAELKQELMDVRSDKGIKSFELTSDIIDISSDEEVCKPVVSTDVPVRSYEPVRPVNDPLHTISQSYGYDDVYRVNLNAIASSAFTEKRYSVHISPNLSVILVCPDDDGDVVCVNNSLCLYGLEFIIPFKGRERMEAEYSSKYNGMLISTRFKP